MTYAKQMFPQSNTQTKILGVVWCKEKDTLSVTTPSVDKKLTKRNILAY